MRHSNRQTAGTTRKYGGTGLGLAISKKLTEILGGQLAVESTLEEGSTFSFKLRLTKSTDSGEEIFTKDAAETLNGKRCLAVDDNPTALDIVKNTLERVGIETLVTDKPERGLAILAGKAPIDILLVDIMMPEVDGFSFLEKAKSIMKAKMPVSVAVSADMRPGTVSRIKDTGFDGYLIKPARRGALLGNDSIATASRSIRQVCDGGKN